MFLMFVTLLDLNVLQKIKVNCIQTVTIQLKTERKTVSFIKLHRNSSQLNMPLSVQTGLFVNASTNDRRRYREKPNIYYIFHIFT